MVLTFRYRIFVMVTKCAIISLIVIDIDRY